MSTPFVRTETGIALDLDRDTRRFITGLAASVLLGSRDGTHPFASRLAPPITVTKDQDDPFLVLARHDVIATAAQVVEETAFLPSLSAEQAEAWFETIQVGCQALAGSLHVTIVEDLDRLDPDDRTRLQIAQWLLDLLCEVLDEPVVTED
jgi:hypothetical protein